VPRFAPVTVTSPPTAAFVGESDAIVGFWITTKLAALVPEPSGVVTVTFAVTAPVGTTAFRLVAVTSVGVVESVPNLTPVAPSRLRPLTVTCVPAAALVGEKPSTRGVTWKVCAAVPSRSGPRATGAALVPPSGTVVFTVVFVADTTGALAAPNLTEVVP